MQAEEISATGKTQSPSADYNHLLYINEKNIIHNRRNTRSRRHYRNCDLQKQNFSSSSFPADNNRCPNPYKNATTVVSGNADVQKTPNYEIVYLANSKSFVISLSGINLADSRSQAEQAFLDSLGVSKEDACKLTVSLGVAPEANKNAAGKNYGLSFCPNGKPLPTN
ncbi:MAG: hypothetical protein NT093_03160 [Candidatus Moranbacteria bacterium]|nr:hypothetical protein [Candidatus Moranbacteria bacterium]